MADDVARVPTKLAVYRRLIGGRIRSDLSYRTSFLVYLAAQLLVVAADFAAVAVVLGRIPTLAGWTAAEVVLLVALSGLSFGVADLFASQAEMAARHIKAGTFDAFLIRPLGTLVQLSAMEFSFRRVGMVIQPLVLLVLVVPRVPVDWTWSKALLLVLSVGNGAVIFGAVWVLTSAVAFWVVDSQEAANSFTYGGNLLTNYPVDVYGRALRGIVVFVVPLAFVAHMPAAAVLGRPLPFGLPAGTAWLGPLVAVAMSLAAAGTWRQAVRHYRSTGS